jgi:hypothetical protein
MSLRITVKILYFFVLVFGAIGIIISFNILLDPSIQKNLFGIIKYDSTEREIMSKIGEYFGGFIGTIFGITSTLLILVSLIKGNIDTHKTNVLNVYFKMLEFHHSNVVSLSISGLYESTSRINGRRAFVTFTSQLYKIYSEVISINKSLSLELSVEQIISITFSAFYYGIDRESESRLKQKISLACPQLNETMTIEIISILKSKKDELKEGSAKHDGIKDESVRDSLEKKRSFNLGITNETSLSAYFSNLYQAIKLVDDDKYFTQLEKYDYIQVLKSQLSVRERIILFAYILSPNGKLWISSNFIEKYNFFNLKDIPNDTSLSLRTIFEGVAIEDF